MSKKGVRPEEYDQFLCTIEQNSCFRFTAGDDESGAFFVPVGSDGKTLIGDCFYLNWKKLEALAKTLTNKKGDD